MARYSKASQKEVEKEMRKFKRGKAHSGRALKPVKSREQAIAIGLSKARRKGAKVPKKSVSATTTKKTKPAKSLKTTLTSKPRKKASTSHKTSTQLSARKKATTSKKTAARARKSVKARTMTRSRKVTRTTRRKSSK